jgi:cytochrome bd-type quinol oxidase subunit 1
VQTCGIIAARIGQTIDDSLEVGRQRWIVDGLLGSQRCRQQQPRDRERQEGSC